MTTKKEKEQRIEWNGMYFSPRFAKKVLPVLKQAMQDKDSDINHKAKKQDINGKP
jgi:hypothetical protein